MRLRNEFPGASILKDLRNLTLMSALRYSDWPAWGPDAITVALVISQNMPRNLTAGIQPGSPNCEDGGPGKRHSSLPILHVMRINCAHRYAPLKPICYPLNMLLEHLGLIGNCQLSALVHRSGELVWCCLPQFDSEPV